MSNHTHSTLGQMALVLLLPFPLIFLHYLLCLLPLHFPFLPFPAAPQLLVLGLGLVHFFLLLAMISLSHLVHCLLVHSSVCILYLSLLPPGSRHFLLLWLLPPHLLLLPHLLCCHHLVRHRLCLGHVCHASCWVPQGLAQRPPPRGVAISRPGR